MQLTGINPPMGDPRAYNMTLVLGIPDGLPSIFIDIEIHGT